MSSKKKPTMTRQEAAELYDDLHKAMNQMMSKQGRNLKDEISKIKTAATASPEIGNAVSMALPRFTRRPARAGRGQAAAVACVLLFAGAKVVCSALEAAGIATVQSAEASIQQRGAGQSSKGSLGRDDIGLLTALDARRSELEKKSRDLDERKAELDRRDSEFTVRLAQLKDLTARMKLDREKDEKKRSAQIDQLANVYGSMNPPEAAQLMEQLDVSIALELIQKMPEKRIGQILALMSPERALSLTKLLSGKKD